MNKDMVNILIKRIKEERFKENIWEINFFKQLPNDLIRMLLGLEKDKFNRYIIFIVLLQNKNLLNCSSDVLISISQTIVVKMDSPSTKLLMNLLVSTRILENLNIVEFSSMLLQIDDITKLETIKQVYFSLNDLNIRNIVNYLGIINRCQNKYQLDLLKKVILNKEIRSHKYFHHIVEMFLRNPDNFNLIEIEKCLHNKDLLKNKNFLYILNHYLLNSKNNQELNLIYETIMNPEFINSRSLIKFLDLIINPENRKYYPLFKRIASQKHNIKDSVFEYLLNSIFKAQNNLQIEAIMSLLNYPELLNEEMQLTFIVEKYLLITKKYQFIALDRLLEKTICLENFDLYNADNHKIIKAIMETSEDYKAYCLANSSQYILNYQYSSTIIEAILNTNNSLICNYITLLLSIENIKESDNFFKIFDSLFKCHNEIQMKAIITLAKDEKIVNSNNYLKLFNIIEKCNEQQIARVLKIINTFDNIEDEILFKYLFNILSEKNNSKIDILEEVIVNHEILGQEKTFEYIALLKNSEKDDYKNVLETLRKEFQELNITTEIKSKKRIFKLGRK